MNRLKVLFIAGLMAFLMPLNVHAGALIIDMETAASGSTTVANGGVSTFYFTAISGTYTTGIAVGDTVIPNISNSERYYSIQINDITGASAYPRGTEFALIIEVSNLNDADAWSGASRIVHFDGGVSVAGNSTYVVSGQLPMCEYARVRLETSGASPTGRVTARAVFR